MQLKSPKKISLLLPTRNRLFLVKRLFESIVKHTADKDNLEIVLCLDDDDFQGHSIEDNRLNLIKIVGPKATMGELNTRSLEASSGDIIMLINDDLVVCTPGWDEIIRKLAENIYDEVYLAYPDDMEKANLSTFPIMSRKTCEILSQPYPKQYDALFIDDHVFDIFKRLKHLGKNRIYYLNNIKFDHRHFIEGNVRQDTSYIHKNRYKDYITFISLIYLRQLSAIRLKAFIDYEKLIDLPDRIEILDPPAGMIEAVTRYSWLFLKDYGLPMRSRLRWFIRFTKYYAAMKVGVGFLKAKTYSLYGS